MSNHESEYKPFPVDCLPEPLATLVNSCSQSIGCDPSYIAAPMLTVLGAAMGNAYRIQTKGGWLAPPVVWTAIIGESGYLKSPPFKVARRPVATLEEEADSDNKAAEREYDSRVKMYDKRLRLWQKDENSTPPPEPPERPNRKRYMTTDTTIEAMALLQEENPKGMFVARDELSGWFGDLCRYKTKSDADRWIEMYNADLMTIDRRGGDRREIKVPNALASVTGGIQPEVLKSCVNTLLREAGMLARFLLVRPPQPVREWNDHEPDELSLKRYEDVVRKLYGVSAKKNQEFVILKMSPGAKSAYVEYFNRHGKELASMTGDVRAAWCKLEEHAIRLAGIIHAAKWAIGDESTASSSTTIDEKTMESAIRLTEWFKSETRRVYAELFGGKTDVGSLPAKDMLRRVIDHVADSGGSMSVRDIQRALFPSDTKTDEVRELLQLAVDNSLATWGKYFAGRPSRFDLNEFAPDTLVY